MTGSHGHHTPQPAAADMAAIVRGLARRFRLPALERRHSTRLVLGLFAFVNGVIAIAVMATLALVTGQPFGFPSLGPTAFLLFTHRSPRRARRDPSPTKARRPRRRGHHRPPGLDGGSVSRSLTG
ncbi:MAG: hypothetical protein M3179_07565 [Actinomycetota bacterium]|nr:hypothetical protein [Actinomycetota bacterium]